MHKLFSILTLASLFFAACSEDSGKKTNQNPQEQGNSGIAEPRSLAYSIVNAYPHDTSAFTQGLELYKGSLFESAGLAGRSSLRKVDLKSGRTLVRKSIDSPYFAEGITVWNDTIYQLTWTNRAVFVYTAADLRLVRKMNWSGEGWGLTHDGKSLIISDGSDKLYFVTPESFALQKVVSVTDHFGPVNNLNELEFINGYVYANRWQYDYILKIDPVSGHVLGRIDLLDILARNSKSDLSYLKRPGSTAETMGAFLNGIAWDSARKKLLVTGKLWPEIFEIEVQELRP